MRNTILVLILSLSLSIFHSCSNSSKQPAEHAELHLNDGKKWHSNSETDTAFNNMKILLAEYQEGGDYKSLSKSLQSECNYMIKNCDMTGEDHNQLHHILHPILAHLDSLKIEDDPKNAEQYIAAIKNHVTNYFKYFEVEEPKN